MPRKIFTAWFGFGVPLYLAGGVLIATFYHLAFGLITLLILLAWIFESAHTTCSRCGFYGTMKCGLPGIVVPWITDKKKTSLSKKRIRIHFYTDIAVMLFILGIYFFFSNWGLLALIWPIGAWLITFGPKRFHGLLFKLKENSKEGFTV